MAQQKVVLGHVKGDQGIPGEMGKISSATATVTPGHLDEPTCTVDIGGEPGEQTLTFTFAGLQGLDGAAAPDSGMVKDVYDKNNKSEDIFQYVDTKIEEAFGSAMEASY